MIAAYFLGEKATQLSNPNTDIKLVKPVKSTDQKLFQQPEPKQ